MPAATRSRAKAAATAKSTPPAANAGWLFTRDIDALIAKHMSLGDKRSMRLVSRAAKALVDSTVTKAVSLAHGALCPLSPNWNVQRLVVSHDDSHDPLLSYLALQRLESLKHFEVEYQLDSIAVLQNAPWLAQLETLRTPLHRGDVDMRDLLRICKSLKSLEIDGYDHENPTYARIAEAGSMPNLRSLVLGGHLELEPAQLRELCQAELTSLKN